MAKARRGRRRRAVGGDRPERSSRAHWRADGQEKTRFASQDDANRAALQLRLEEGADLDPYPCPVCGNWHLASHDR